MLRFAPLILNLGWVGLVLSQTSMQGVDAIDFYDSEPLKWVAPYYYPPFEHETVFEGGQVLIEATVGPEGSVYWAKVIDASRIPTAWHKGFEITAKRWRFEPQPKQLVYKVKIRFVFTVLPADSPDAEMVTRFIKPNTVEIRLVNSQRWSTHDPRFKKK